MLTIATNDTSNNTEKNISKFCCEICNFNAVKLGDYKRHLLTRKSPKRKRRLRKGGLLTTSMSKRIQKLVQVYPHQRNLLLD